MIFGAKIHCLPISGLGGVRERLHPTMLLDHVNKICSMVRLVDSMSTVTFDSSQAFTKYDHLPRPYTNCFGRVVPTSMTQLSLRSEKFIFLRMTLKSAKSVKIFFPRKNEPTTAYMQYLCIQFQTSFIDFHYETCSPIDKQLLIYLTNWWTKYKPL